MHVCDIRISVLQLLCVPGGCDPQHIILKIATTSAGKVVSYIATEDILDRAKPDSEPIHSHTLFIRAVWDQGVPVTTKLPVSLNVLFINH